MLIDLNPQESVFLLESLARDIERQQSTINDVNHVYLQGIAAKVRNQIVEDMSTRNKRATREQVSKYIDGQLRKIQEMRRNSEENVDDGKQLNLF